MMITSTETSSSVIPPTAPPIMGMGTTVSEVGVGFSKCTEVGYMMAATSLMFYNTFTVI